MGTHCVILVIFFLLISQLPKNYAVHVLSVMLSEESSEMVDILKRIALNFTNENPKFRLEDRLLDNSTNILTQMCRSLHRKNRPYLGSLTPQTMETIYAMTQRFNFPYLSWDINLNWPRKTFPSNFYSGISNPPQKTCSVFSLQPDLTDPLINFLLQWNWQKFAYISTTDRTFDRLQRVLLELNNLLGSVLHVDVVKVSLDDIHGSIDRLKQLDRRLKDRKYRRIVLDIAGKTNILNFLSSLRLLGMLREEYHYLIVDFGILELPLGPYKASRVTISGFQIVDYKRWTIRNFLTNWAKFTVSGVSAHQIAFILDSMEVLRRVLTNSESDWYADDNGKCNPPPFCWKSASAIQGPIKRENYFKNSNLDQDCSTENYLVQRIKNLKFVGYTGSVSFDPDTCSRNDFTIILSQFSGEQPSRYIATWTTEKIWKQSTPKSVLDEELKDPYTLTHPFINHTVRVVTILSEPFMMYTNDAVGKPKSGKANFEGYCKDLADEVFKNLGINYDIHLVKDGKYGAYSHENKSWNGIIGELIREEADLAFAPLTVNSNREKSIDFSEPFMTFGLSIIIKKPGATKPGTFSFLLPLSHDIWIAISSSCCLVTLGLWIIARCSPYEWKEEGEIAFNFSNSFWFSFAAFVRQGVDFSPVSPGARILSSIWWFFSMLMIAYYTANLVAFLSVERVITPVSNVKDLVEKGPVIGIKTGTLDAGSTKEYFASSKHYPIKALYHQMEADKSQYARTIKEGIDRVRKQHGFYAFILESKMNEFTNHRLPCDTMKVGPDFGKKEYAVALPSHRPEMVKIREDVTNAILQLRENQVLDTLYEKWWIQKGECSNEQEGSSSKPLDLVNVSGAFYILIIGIVLAMFVGLVSALRDLVNYRRQLKRWRYSDYALRTPTK